MPRVYHTLLTIQTLAFNIFIGSNLNPPKQRCLPSIFYIHSEYTNIIKNLDNLKAACCLLRLAAILPSTALV